MASRTEEDYAQLAELDFVEPPPKEFECPLCLQVLTEPVLSSCCGHHFCQACIDRAVARNNACPLCNEQNFETFLNKNIQRKINELKVYCRQKSQGCEWAGELSSLNHHLDVECGFIQLECEFSSMGCCAKFLKKDSAKHKEENIHYHMMLTASAASENQTARIDFERKIQDDLQQQIQKDDDKIGGIQACLQVKEKELREVREQVAGNELEMIQMHHRITQMEQNLQESISLVEEKVSEKRQQILQIEQRLQMIEKQLKFRPGLQSTSPTQDQTPHTDTGIAIIPTPKFTMTNFEEHKWIDDDWYSPPFYTHPGGYKMCLRVRAGGQLSGSGTHVSAFFHLMRGEYDDYLSWPFCGEVILQVQNQRKDEWHWKKSILFSDPKTCVRVTESERGTLGMGAGDFLPYKKLGYNHSTGTEYLKNNCLTFQVIRITIYS